MALTVIPAILYIFFEEKDLQMKLRAIGPTSHWLMGAINYFSLLYQQKQIHRSIEHMEADWRMTKREHDYQIMLKNARVGRIIVGICALFMQGSIFLYSMVRGMSPFRVVVGNETITMPGLLPCPAFNLIVDTRFSPVYEVIFTLQCLSSIVVNNVTSGACGLAAVFAMHACGQLNVVMSQLEELDEDKEYDLVQRKLARLVERHLRALR